MHYTPRHDYESCVKNGERILKAGSTILTCEPFAYALQTKFRLTRCDTCFKRLLYFFLASFFIGNHK